MKIFIPDTSGYVNSILSNKLIESGHEVLKAPFNSFDSVNYPSLGNFINTNNPDAIIIDINQPDNHVKYTEFLTILKEFTYNVSTTLLALSTVQTWNQTLKSSRKALSEHMFKSRKCSARYKPIRVLESLVLSTTKDNLSPYIIASGLIYGVGENELSEFFRLSWMNQNNYNDLPVLSEEKDEGKNLIPTIHIYDLISIIKFVLENGSTQQLETQYIVATDNSSTTQLQLIQAIAKGINNGKTRFVSPTSESILLNPTSYPIHPELIISDMRFEPEYTSTLPLEWHCESGLTENFEIIRQEFVTARKLKPLRILIHGPPTSGKSYYARLLGEKYFLPVINIKQAIDEALERKDELSEQIQANLTQSAAALAKSAKSKKNRKSTPTKAAANKSNNNNNNNNTKSFSAELPEYDTPRLSAYMLSKIMKRKLREFDPRNKGFLLDGFPRTAEEANYLFQIDCEEDDLGNPIPHELPEKDDKGNDINPIPRDPSTMIEFVISLEINEKQAIERSKNLKDNEIILGHNTEDGFKRRWNRFEIIENRDSEILLSVLSVLPEIEILTVPYNISNNDKNQTINIIASYVEKKGKPYNYHPTAEEIAISKQKQEELENKELAEKQALLQDMEQKEKQIRNNNEDAAAKRRIAVLLEDQQLIEAASQPLRGYLLEHVVPAVVEGLLDVCKQKPADPVDYLAEYLFKYALGATNTSY